MVRFFVPASVGRLGVAMSGLAVMWAVHGVSGSFGAGGAASGVFAAAEALAGPQIGRLIDRWGQRRVVPVSAGVFAVAAALLVAACAGAAATGVLLGLAAVVGATVPPVGALSAARWRGIDEARAAGLSLDGAVNDVAFLVGPMLVTGLGAVFVPWAGLALALGLVVVGVAGLVTATGTEPAPGRASTGMIMDRRLVERRFLGLFVANLALGLFFGGIGVVIAGFAFAHGAQALTGAVTAVAGVVSLVAGLVYGSVPALRPRPVMLGAGLVLTGGCALLALAPGMAAMFAGYAVVGGAVALVVIPGAVLLRHVVAAGVYTQAVTWINSASAAGIAVAAPVIGVVVQRHGWPAGFLVLAGLTATLPLALLLFVPGEDSARVRR